MKNYYQIIGYLKGNEIVIIDTDGNPHPADKIDHNSKMVFESEKDAEKFIDVMDRENNHPEFTWKVEIWDPGSLFLVDSWNNHKVIGEFDTIDHVNEYLEAKEHAENWENTADTFDDYLDGFYTVEWQDMAIAVQKYGKRKLEYWT